MTADKIYTFLFHITTQHFLSVFGFAIGVALLFNLARISLTQRLDAWLEHNKREWIILGICSLIVAAYFITTNIIRYNAFLIPVYDFGIYDHMIWRISQHLSPDISYIHARHWLGDHWQPILALFAPLYWAWSSPYWLLILEPLIVVSGVIPLILLAKKYKLPPVSSLSLAIAYLLWGESWSALFYTFHPSTLVPTLLLWAFWAFEFERWGIYALSLLLTLMTKENAALYVAFYGAWQVLFTKQKRVGLATLLAGALWGWTTITYLIPYFSHNPYPNAHLDPSLLGSYSTPLEVLQHNPGRFYDIATNVPHKQTILWSVITSFGGLGLLVPDMWVILIPFLSERLFSDNPLRYTFGFHYGLPIVAVLTYMAIRSLSRLHVRWPIVASNWSLVILISALLGLGLTTIPLNTVRLNQAYHASRVSHLKQAIAVIPPDASVLAQDDIATHLSHRAKIQILGNNDDPVANYDYVAVDADSSYYPLHTIGFLRDAYQSIADNPNYGLIYSQGTTAVWQKGVPNQVPYSHKFLEFLQF